jgi:glycerol-3-phosphate acyltransferase PlsY
MNEKMKRLTETFGWILFLAIYGVLIFFVISLLQTSGPTNWWSHQNIWMQIMVCFLGVIVWCVYTLFMFWLFWMFNALWLWFMKKIIKAKNEIDAIKKSMSNETLKS